MTNNSFLYAHKLLFAFMGIVALFLGSCGKDDPAPVEITVSVPSAIQINVVDDKATITGKADAGSEVTLQYDAELGSVARKVRVDASGNFSTTVDLLVEYEQQLVAFASKGDKTSEIVKLPKIAAKASYSRDLAEARTKIQAHRWKSDQTVSRVIVRQTAATPPYDMFATVAQKYFDFKAGGAFHFEVTSPLQFIHDTGTWTMDENGVITINTVIPLGAMQINNAKIQYLDANRLTLLANIADGLFLLSMTKE